MGWAEAALFWSPQSSPAMRRSTLCPSQDSPCLQMALGSGPKWINLSGLWKFRGKPAPPKVLHIHSLFHPQRAWGLLFTLFVHFQLGFPKGLFCCLIGIDKIPRTKAMLTFSASKCTNIFSLLSITVRCCLAGARPHQLPCTCGGGRDRGVIPCARAALALAGRTDCDIHFCCRALCLLLHTGIALACYHNSHA